MKLGKPKNFNSISSRSRFQPDLNIGCLQKLPFFFSKRLERARNSPTNVLDWWWVCDENVTGFSLHIPPPRVSCRFWLEIFDYSNPFVGGSAFSSELSQLRTEFAAGSRNPDLPPVPQWKSNGLAGFLYRNSRYLVFLGRNNFSLLAKKEWKFQIKADKRNGTGKVPGRF